MKLILLYHSLLTDSRMTPGNVDDRKPVSKISRKLFGKLFADKGYISKKLAEELLPHSAFNL